MIQKYQMMIIEMIIVKMGILGEMQIEDLVEMVVERKAHQMGMMTQMMGMVKMMRMIQILIEDP